MSFRIRRTDALTLTPSFHLLSKKVEEEGGDAVVAEVEIFQVNAVLGLANRLKHVVELLLSAHQERNRIVVGKTDAFPRSWLTINESLVCALHSELASISVIVAYYLLVSCQLLIIYLL